jgi:nucleoporin p58/p45
MFGGQNNAQGQQNSTGFGLSNQTQTHQFGSSTQQNTLGSGLNPTAASSGNTFGTNLPAANTGGLFGSTSSATGLFGNAGATNGNNGGNIFGGNAAATQSGGLFGNKLAQPSTNSLGTTSSLFGTAQTQPGMIAQVQNTNMVAASHSFTLQTKYSELPEPFQKELDNIEKFIQSQIQASSLIASRSIEEILNEVVSETEDTQRKLGNLRNVLRRDLYLIEQLKSLVTKEVRHSDLVARYIDSSHTEDLSKSNLNNDAYARYIFHDSVTLIIS